MLQEQLKLKRRLPALVLQWELTLSQTCFIINGGKSKQSKNGWPNFLLQIKSCACISTHNIPRSNFNILARITLSDRPLAHNIKILCSTVCHERAQWWQDPACHTFSRSQRDDSLCEENLFSSLHPSVQIHEYSIWTLLTQIFFSTTPVHLEHKAMSKQNMSHIDIRILLKNAAFHTWANILAVDYPHLSL